MFSRPGQAPYQLEPQAPASQEGQKYTVGVKASMGSGGYALGTGAVIKYADRTVIITAAHVVRGGRSFQILVAEGWFPAKLLASDEKDDAAILQCDERRLNATELTDDESGALSHWGMSGTSKLHLRTGRKTRDIARNGFFLSVPAKQGDSGAGVFNGAKCCGVVSATDSRETVVVKACCFRGLLVRLFGGYTPQPPVINNIMPATPSPNSSGLGQGDLDKIRQEVISRLETENAKLIARLEKLQEQFEQLRNSPISLDVVNEDGSTSTTTGNLSGKKLKLRFQKVQPNATSIP